MRRAGAASQIYVFNLDAKIIEQILEHPDYPQTNILKCDEISGLW